MAAWQQIRDIVARLTVGQKVGIVLAALTTMGLIWGVVSIAGHEHYEIVYADLDPGDATDIAARLREENIPYRLSPGGRAIEVPVSRVDEARLTLSGAGLPRGGGAGFEMFDNSTFGMSDFVQNVNYRRALERELERTIERLDDVARARVHVAVPSESLFADEKRTAKASVVVELRGGRGLGAEEVAAISHLVSSAVDGMTPQKVSIVDTAGRVLSDGEGDGSMPALTASQLGLKAETEHQLMAKMIGILEPIVGAGRVRARADVTLDFTRVQRTEEIFDPEGSVVRSEQKTKEKRQGARPGGAPGVASNLPPGSAPRTGAGSLDESSKKTVNYEVNRTVRNITEPVGAIKRLAVAVVVDNPSSAAAADGAAGEGAGRRTEEEMRQITALVKAAVGYNEERGDVLTVENVPFDTGPPEALPTSAPGPGRRFWIEVTRYAALVIVALIILMFVIRPAQRAVRAALIPAGAGGGATALVPHDVESMRRRLIDLTANEPEGAARVLGAMIAEKE
ncbi:MAG: flagellar basal-body MS-ring/collar protein FliF [Acidobacteriota bacterium]